jgi:signal transduction histidine kinase
MKHSTATEKKTAKAEIVDKNKSQKNKSLQDLRATILKKHYRKNETDDSDESENYRSNYNSTVTKSIKNNDVKSEIEFLKDEIERLKEQENQTSEVLGLKHQLAGVLEQLIPDFIHDISSPISLLEYSLSNLMEDHHKAMKLVTSFSFGLNDSNCALEIYNYSQTLTSFTSWSINQMELRSMKKILVLEIQEFKFKNVQRGADIFVNSGIFHVDDKLKSLFTRQNGEQLFELLISLLSIKQSFSILESAKNKSNNLITTLRNYTRKQLGSDPELFDLKASLEIAIAMLGHRLRSRKFSFSYDVSCFVLGDIQHMAHIWINLLSNAVEATDSMGTIKVKVIKEGNDILVKVKDNGSGIPEENLNKIFMPYYTTKKNQAGTGIGLDICKKYLDSLKAKIEVVSKPGETVFTVRITEYAKGIR